MPPVEQPAAQSTLAPVRTTRSTRPVRAMLPNFYRIIEQNTPPLGRSVARRLNLQVLRVEHARRRRQFVEDEHHGRARLLLDPAEVLQGRVVKPTLPPRPRRIDPPRRLFLRLHLEPRPAVLPKPQDIGSTIISAGRVD